MYNIHESMKRTAFYALLVAFLASVFIFYQFNQAPKGLSRDEIDFVSIALRLDGAPYQAYTTAATGHSTLYFYVILFLFKTLGISQTSFRLTSAVSGVVAAVFFYLICKKVLKKDSISLHITKKRMFSIEVAFLTTLILISMRWYFGFARFSFEATFLLMFELIALYFVLLFRSSQSIPYLVISALATGLAYNSYTPGRIFVLLIIAIIFVSSKNKKLHLALFSGFFAVTIAPLTQYFLTHEDIRIQQQLYLKNPELSIFDKAGYFATNLWKNIRMLFGEGDMNGRHNYPYKSALNPVLYSLFGLGLFSFFRIKRTFFHNMFAGYLLIGLLPTLLTYPHENPNMLRTFTVLPALAFFVGQGIVWIYTQVKDDVKKVQIVSVMIIIFLTISIFYEARTYFVFQKLVFIQAFDVMNVFSKLPK